MNNIDTQTLLKLGKNLSCLPNYKEIGEYYIKNKVLGQGSFAKTLLATKKTDQSQIFACKTINKQ